MRPPQTIRDVQRLNGKIATLSRFVSKSAEGRYPEVEKYAYALIISAKKLRPYFQAHTIKVLTDKPLKQVLAKPETSSRLIKWSVELGEYDVKFEARSTIKSQVLADFVRDNTPTECMEEDPSESERGIWKLSVDGSSCLTGSGAGLVLTSADGWTLEYALRFKFKATNNEVEWEALIAGLKIAKHLEVQKIEASSDSQLVVGLKNGEYEAREDPMVKYLSHFQGMKSAFKILRIVKVPRAENVRADQLSKLATAEELEKNQTVLVDYLDSPTISEVDVMDIDVPQGPNWMTPFINWLRNGILPEDPVEARKLVYRANRFQFRDGILYKRFFSFPWLRCLNPSEADYALREVHEGICGNHTGAGHCLTSC
ncbi:RVT_3 domain-containing protein [Cephalotus follicularis]|uniref:RVT_3 domain-containing protein n=1 Tax=Cephalotus follicularis TaxID=3775 RepID=A0A1Q3D1Z6_CEPFO|nr:RVT_3 domain-containing protein [Cephalotus follicularis]